MRSHRILQTIAFTAATALTATVYADATFHPDNSEAGSANHAAPGKLTRADREAQTRAEAQRLDPHWLPPVGEGSGELRQHSFDLIGGKWKHSDSFPHDTPRPTAPRTRVAETSPGA